MRQQESGFQGLVDPLDLVGHFPGEPFAVSDRVRWAGLRAFRYRDQPPNESSQPALTHHSLVLFLHTPKELELQCEGVNRVVPPRVGSVLLVPAGQSSWWRWGSHSDSLHVFLDPGLVARVAAEAFEFDPARATVPPLDGLYLPPLRSAMLAVNDELATAAGGGRLAIESLANLLAVHLIRSTSGPGLPVRRTEGALPRTKLRAVVEYIEEHLDADLTLERMAAAAHLSPYHFARQFKVATGTPPHRYVLERRIERAQRLLERGGEFSLAEIAMRAGFSDQSHFTHHFKRVVGVTPKRFRMSARIR